MPSVNVDINYFGHVKVKKLIGRLGRGSDVIPIRLWCYTGMHHCDDGRLVNHTSEEVESALAWWGTKGKCVEALLAIRFLEQDTDGVYFVHDWNVHAKHFRLMRERSRKGNAKRWGHGDDPPTRSPTRTPNDEVKESSYIHTYKASKQDAGEVAEGVQFPDAYRLAKELQIGHTLTPQAMPMLNELIIDFGYEQAEKSCRVGIENGANGGTHMIKFARTNAVREANKARLSSGRNASAALAQEDG